MTPRDPNDPYADYDEQRLLIFLSSMTPAAAGEPSGYSNVGAALLGAALARRAERKNRSGCGRPRRIVGITAASRRSSRSSATLMARSARSSSFKAARDNGRNELRRSTDTEPAFVKPLRLLWTVLMMLVGAVVAEELGALEKGAF